MFHASISCSDHEMQVLLQFKSSLIQNSSTDDEINYDLESWDSNTINCCDWERVFCDDSSSHVVALDLSKLYLETLEVVAPIISNITSLKKLDLSKNFLRQGEIPENVLANLFQLESDLSYNYDSDELIN
ncbi:hypothetical protein Scep_008587 [Stephania cephalantha]|uniref:Leucine-rich repeat-containing N-terminal plant-type domain-containing protein n=1 Tax=Stephania cephalantha TaxID=152367 RepID=A0AAP0PPQ9_9MAGN